MNNSAPAHARGPAEPSRTAEPGNVHIRSDAGATGFLRANQAVAATVDADTVFVRPEFAGSRAVLSHEYAHIAQLRSGRSATRAQAEASADASAAGSVGDAGGAAAPPLFQKAPPAHGGVLPDPAAQERAELHDLPKAHVETKDDVSVLGDVLAFAYHASAAGGRETGSIVSRTDVALQMFQHAYFGDPAHVPTRTSRPDLENFIPPSSPSAPRQRAYPIVVNYRRTILLKDHEGHDCDVRADYSVYFTVETWRKQLAGRRAGLATLTALRGDFGVALGSVHCRGDDGPKNAGFRNTAVSIDEQTGAAEAQLSQDFVGRADVPAPFVRANETAGQQYDALETFLHAAGAPRVKPPQPKPPPVPAHVAPPGKPEFDPNVRDSPGPVPDDEVGAQTPRWLTDLLSALSALWDKIPWPIRVTLKVIGGLLVAAVVVALAAEIIVGIAASALGVTLSVTAVAAALVAIGLTISFVSALKRRIAEAQRTGVHSWLRIGASAFYDAIGLGGVLEGITNKSLLSHEPLNLSKEERLEAAESGAIQFLTLVFGAARMRPRAGTTAPDVAPEPEPESPPPAADTGAGQGANAPRPGDEPPDHPGMDEWTEGHDPDPQVVTALRRARCTIGEQGMAFAGYPQSEGWGFIEGPSGAGGHAWNAPGFDGVAFRVRGPFEIHILDNKAFAAEGNVSSSSALTTNLAQNLTDLRLQIADPVYDAAPRIAQVRASIAAAEAAVRGRTPLPSDVSLVVTNFGGRSTGITAGLEALGVTFRGL